MFAPLWLQSLSVTSEFYRVFKRVIVYYGVLQVYTG